MKNAALYKEIMREYERDRHAANHLLQKRREEVYALIPRVRAIDEEQTFLGVRIARQIVEGGGDKENAQAQVQAKGPLEALQYTNGVLAEEKRNLLQSRGYTPDYFTDIYHCPRCRDTGYIGGERCKCLTQRLIDRYYDLSNLKHVLQKENFDTFDLNYYDDQMDPRAGVSPRDNMRRIYMECLNFVQGFGKEFQNLLLYGGTALGKTFLCNCIAKELLDGGNNVVYVTASRLFKLVEALRFNRSEDDDPSEYMDMVFYSDLLIIDDLGTEFSTAVTAAELFNIINTRALDQRPVIISTNLSPADFEGQYSDRITSRLLGNYKLLKFIGDDIRLKKRYGMA